MLRAAVAVNGYWVRWLCRYVCFHVLLNLAEDVAIEKKMKNRRRLCSAPPCGVRRRSTATAVLAARVCQGWPGPPVPPVRACVGRAKV
jgi:hypothetical protein